MSFTRRKFLTTAALTSTAGLVLGAPSIAKAQSSERFNWRMTNAYSPGSPFYVEGPGSPTDVIAKINAMSGGRLNIQHFSAGELIPALEGFEAVQSGTIQIPTRDWIMSRPFPAAEAPLTRPRPDGVYHRLGSFPTFARHRARRRRFIPSW